jgi:hypothetical protein
MGEGYVKKWLVASGWWLARREMKEKGETKEKSTTEARRIRRSA